MGSLEISSLPSKPLLASLSHTYTLNFYFIGTLPGIGIKELCESMSFSTSELLQALKKGHQFVRNDPSCRYGQVVFAEDDPGQRRAKDVGEHLKWESNRHPPGGYVNVVRGTCYSVD